MTHCVRILCLALIVGMVGWTVNALGATPVPDIRNPSVLCTGRFVVELPSGATPALNATFQYMESQPPRPAENFDTVKRDIESQAKKLGEVKVERDANSDKLWRRGGFDPDKIFGETRLVGFQSDDSVQQLVIGYMIKPDMPQTVTELHKFANGRQYIFKSEGGGADTFPRTRDAVWNAALHFRPIALSAIPVGPGFCVAGGMFADDGRPPVHEKFTLVVYFKNHPDAKFTIDAHAIDRVNTDEPSLKHRADSELGILRQNVDGHVAVLVRGEHEAAGQQGYQIGLSVPNDTVPNTTAYKFFWSADGVPNDVTRPFMEVDLTIQPTEDGKSTIKDGAEAKALWERLIGSLHIRPGAARQ